MSKAAKDFEQKCKVFFNECNGGEPVSICDLAKCIRKASPGFKGTDQDIAQMFLEIDTDQDKLISWDEFTDALFKRNPKEVTRSELETTFKGLDKDGSGKLDRGEVRQLAQSVGMDISEEGLDKLLSKADPNGDGVSYQEFLDAWASN
ncbi:calmodulin-A [Aplysia californica]|uniref:Calmodulin-A n=1 Tax=Aplysia californica TaxID=6500 RepID=A0ABM0JF16_APLCA|nr:calmodulin-A [Aplysia californica]